MTIALEQDAKNAEIKRLNDRLRLKGRGGYSQMCDRMSDFSYERFAEVRKAIRAFDDFTPDNDPHGHHDYGVVEVHDQKYDWEIGYLGADGTGVSPDPSDTSVTTRVMWISMVPD